MSIIDRYIVEYYAKHINADYSVSNENSLSFRWSKIESKSQYCNLFINRKNSKKNRKLRRWDLNRHMCQGQQTDIDLDTRSGWVAWGGWAMLEGRRHLEKIQTLFNFSIPRFMFLFFLLVVLIFFKFLCVFFFNV